jgi:nitronate monooxygenase
MFIVSNPKLVIAQCQAGIIGSFPALGARSSETLDEWLAEITETLAAYDRTHPDAPSAPFAVNQIVHRTNARLEGDLALCAKHKAPIVITSLGARSEIFDAVHDFGAFAMHDVINDRFGRKAIERGADGLIAVAAGAGGHAGATSPFALVAELRRWFSGALVLSGSIATGRAILAAEVLGADLAYIGSPFIATDEANAVEAYKQMVVACSSDDVVYTDFFSGVRGNYLKPSIIAAGLDPDNLDRSDPSKMSFASGGAKAWKDIWGCGQGIGAVNRVQPAADLVAQLSVEYFAAKRDMSAPGAVGPPLASVAA